MCTGEAWHSVVHRNTGGASEAELPEGLLETYYWGGRLRSGFTRSPHDLAILGRIIVPACRTFAQRVVLVSGDICSSCARQAIPAGERHAGVLLEHVIGIPVSW